MGVGTKYENPCIACYCHQRATTREEALNNQGDRITQLEDVSQYLSLATLCWHKCMMT